MKLPTPMTKLSSDGERELKLKRISEQLNTIEGLVHFVESDIRYVVGILSLVHDHTPIKPFNHNYFERS